MVVVMNFGCQNILIDFLNFIEGYLEEIENLVLLRFILLGKYKIYFYSFKFFVCLLDVELECFFEIFMSLFDLENLGYQQVYELDMNLDKLENWRSVYLDVLIIDVDEYVFV